MLDPASSNEAHAGLNSRMGHRTLREGKALMAHPTFGFRTFKGQGSRLLRDTDNDWVNIQAREGTAGWKKGLLFTRHYAYQEKGINGAQHLYRYECLRLIGLDTVATAYGKTNDEARSRLYDVLKQKGVMPIGEPEDG
jgi:hypothetical protein